MSEHLGAGQEPPPAPQPENTTIDISAELATQLDEVDLGVCKPLSLYWAVVDIPPSLILRRFFFFVFF
jgi:hypothetical protein